MLTMFDIETSGLNRDGDVILEAAYVVVHPETLEAIADGVALVDHAERPYLNPTVREMHTENGLLAALSRSGLPHMAEGPLMVDGHAGLDDWLAARLRKAGATPASVMLSGMSIQFDRGFLEAKCPNVCALLSHRMIDLSTIRELLRFWAPLGATPLPKKGVAHRALADCYEALETLRWYQKNAFHVPLLQPMKRLKESPERGRFIYVAREMEHAAPGEQQRAFNRDLCDFLLAL
jgi:oligoribonuclease